MTTDLFNNPLPPLVERKPKKPRLGQQLHIAPEIKSISFDQQELLQSILTLYVVGNTFDVDATYGYGEFYAGSIARPKHCFDIDPKKPEATRGDCRNLPLPSSSVKSLMFDPPFVVTNHINSEEYVMGQKYGGYRTITELREHYKTSLSTSSPVCFGRGAYWSSSVRISCTAGAITSSITKYSSWPRRQASKGLTCLFCLPATGSKGA